MSVLVRYHCHLGALNGIGRAARDNLCALVDYGDFDVDIAPIGDARRAPDLEPRFGALNDYVGLAFDGLPDVEIFHSTPRVLATLLKERSSPLAGDPGRWSKKVALTTWETSYCPPENIEMLARFDHIIVPSEFCASVITADMPNQWFLDGGRVWTVPHCFDEDWWPASETPSHPTLDQPRFRFYTIGAWSERKNLLGVLRAYLHAFTATDRVELVMLIDNPDLNEIRKTIALSGLEPDALPKLDIPDGLLDENGLIALHLDGHCFVSAHRGEGWGLGLFEAATMGKRIITPMWSGEVDFLEVYERVAYGSQTVMRVPHQLTPCFGLARFNVAGGGRAQVAVGLPHGVNCKQLWMEPDLRSLAMSMRLLYQNSDVRNVDEIRAGRQALEQRFGYKVVGPKLATVLKEICHGESASSSE